MQLNVFLAHQDILQRLHLAAEACENVSVVANMRG